MYEKKYTSSEIKEKSLQRKETSVIFLCYKVLQQEEKTSVVDDLTKLNCTLQLDS